MSLSVGICPNLTRDLEVYELHQYAESKQFLLYNTDILKLVLEYVVTGRDADEKTQNTKGFSEVCVLAHSMLHNQMQVWKEERAVYERILGEKNARGTEKLNCWDCKIGIIPSQLKRCSWLKVITFTENTICNEHLVNLPLSVETLSISANHLTDISALCNYPNLKEIYARCNNITFIPMDIGDKLTRLKWVDLLCNCIERVPESIAKLAHLQWFDVEENNVVEIPASLEGLAERGVLWYNNLVP